MKKNNKKRHLSKKTLIYSIGTITSCVAVLLAAPIYTRTLSTSEFGNYELSYSLIFLLCTVGFFDIHTAMLRFMYGETEESEEAKNKAIYSSGFLVIILVALLFLTVPLTSIITTLPFVKASIFYGIFFSFANFYQNVARGSDRDLEYSLAFSIYHIINLITVIYLLIGRKYSSWSLLIAMGTGHIIEIIYLEIKLKVIKNFKSKYIDFRLIRRMFKFALPLAVSALGTWILNYYTNIQIVKLIDAHSNGIYSMAVNIARSIPSISFGLLMAWQEVAFSFKGDLAEKKVYFSKAIEKILVFLSLVYIFFLCGATLVIPYYLDNSYLPVLNVLFLVTGCMTFETISNMMASIFGNSINSKPIMVSILIGAIIDLIILGPFINKWGIVGAGYASLIGFGLTSIIRVVWIMKVEELKINVKKILFYVCLSFVGAYIGKMKDQKILIITAVITGIMLLINVKKDRSKKDEKYS